MITKVAYNYRLPLSLLSEWSQNLTQKEIDEHIVGKFTQGLAKQIARSVKPEVKKDNEFWDGKSELVVMDTEHFEKLVGFVSLHLKTEDYKEFLKLL